MEWIALLMVALVFILLIFGFPVAFTLAGVATITGILTLGPEFFNFLPSRIMGVMSNYVLLAVPLFIFMGIMLEKSGMAATLLKMMSRIFGKVNGGLGVSVIIVGTLLAASTGIVGATVVTMGLISLPSMMESRYNIPLATGIIASSGTLGQIIPPSIVLILLGTVLNVSVGNLFLGAVIPGLIIVGLYISYVLILSWFKPEVAPPVAKEYQEEITFRSIITALLMPMDLIIAVLGSIFAGIASPTEAAAVVAFGSIVLTIAAGKFRVRSLILVARETTRLTTMVFFIFIGATTYSLVLRGLHGDDLILELILSTQLSPGNLMILILFVVFILGFFIDFVEIVFIIVPIVLPILQAYDIDLLWVGILLGVNLQTSFLTPPFGFSLFYLKGVAPPEVQTRDIYKGIIPFVAIQILVLIIIFNFPGLIRLLIPL